MSITRRALAACSAGVATALALGATAVASPTPVTPPVACLERTGAYAQRCAELGFRATPARVTTETTARFVVGSDVSGDEDLLGGRRFRFDEWRDHECRLDGDVVVPCGERDAVVLGGLAPGRHTFSVRATAPVLHRESGDEANDHVAETRFTWTVVVPASVEPLVAAFMWIEGLFGDRPASLERATPVERVRAGGEREPTAPVAVPAPVVVTDVASSSAPEPSAAEIVPPEAAPAVTPAPSAIDRAPEPSVGGGQSEVRAEPDRPAEEPVVPAGSGDAEPEVPADPPPALPEPEREEPAEGHEVVAPPAPVEEEPVFVFGEMD